MTWLIMLQVDRYITVVRVCQLQDVKVTLQSYEGSTPPCADTVRLFPPVSVRGDGPRDSYSYTPAFPQVGVEEIP